MEYVTMYGYYVCSWCGSELCPGNSKKGEATSSDARAVLLDEAKRKDLMRKKGSTSRKAGRKRQDKPRVTSWWIRE